MIDRPQLNFSFLRSYCGLFYLEGETVNSGLFRKAINILFPKVPDDITNRIDKANIENISIISIIVALYDTVCYILVFAGLIKVESLKETTISVAFVVFLSVIFFIYSKRVKTRERVSHIKTMATLAVAFILLSAYSMKLCYDHYREGRDIITFYIVMVVFAAFIIVKPYLSVTFLFAAFFIFYQILYSFDGARLFHMLNYFAFAGICCVASVTKYHLMLKQQQIQQEVTYLNNALELSVRYDSLTKLKNRHALAEDCKDYYNKPIYIAMCDCDNFKTINDRYGHIVGDRVLAAIAQVFRDTLKSDYIYRYGGDEFLLVNNNMSSDVFEALITRLNTRMDNIHIEGLDEKLTCSFGKVSGIAESDAEFEALIQAADKNMYLEKQRKKENNNN